MTKISKKLLIFWMFFLIISVPVIPSYAQSVTPIQENIQKISTEDNNEKTTESAVTDEEDERESNFSEKGKITNRGTIKEAQKPDMKKNMEAEVLSDSSDLQNLINSTQNNGTVEIENNMVLDTPLRIDKSITLKAQGNNNVVLTSSENLLHANIEGDQTDVKFDNVVLDGNNAGGGINVEGTVTIKGANVRNCNQTVTDMGGAMTVSENSSVTLDNTSVTDNVKSGDGGGIYVKSGARLILNETSVTSNEAVGVGSYTTRQGQGGGISGSNDSIITINQGSSIDGNKSCVKGGGIASEGRVNIYGGSVNNNILDAIESIYTYGGGAYAKKIVMTDGDVSHNTFYGSNSTTNGGGLASISKDDDGGIELSGGTISYNKIIPTSRFGDMGQYGSGGGVSAAQFKMTGGEVHHNEVDPTTSGQGGLGGGVVSQIDGYECTITGGKIYNNTAEVGGGIYCPERANDRNLTTIGGNAEITGNKATSEFGGGGIMFYAGRVTNRLIIGGQSIIKDNEALKNGAGGGISTSSFPPTANTNPETLVTIKDNALISGNKATLKGGGIYILGYAKVSILNNAKIMENTAQQGGGIAIDVDANLHLGYDINSSTGRMSRAADTGVVISDNSGIAGGGIMVGATSTLETHDQNPVLLSSNHAGTETQAGNGGAVYTEMLSNAAIGAGTVFRDNEATVPYKLSDPAYIDLHDSKIKALEFTHPFEYAYNNYDINYVEDKQLGLYTVEFHIEGEPVRSVERVVEGSRTPFPNTEVRRGYTFNGWYTDPELSIPWNENDRIDRNMILYGNYIETAETPDPGGNDNTAATGNAVGINYGDNGNTNSENEGNGNRSSSDGETNKTYPSYGSNEDSGITSQTNDDFSLIFILTGLLISIIILGIVLTKKKILNK